MNDRQRVRSILAAADLATRAAVAIESTDIVDRIRDQTLGLPKSAGGGGGRRCEVWCWFHQRPVDACHRDGDFCNGESIEIRDPVAEAAIAPDRARIDMRQLDRDIAHLERVADRVLCLLQRYQPRAATDSERVETAEGDPGCWSCARLLTAQGAPRWEPVRRNRVVDGESRPLCAWCERWHMRTNHLPSRDLLERHHAGERIMLPADA